MSTVFSASPSQVAVQVARWYEVSKGALHEVIAQRKAKGSGSTLVTSPVGEDFQATKVAAELHDACKSDAEINGGKHAYDIIGIADDGVAVGKMILTVDTGREYTDELRNTSGEVQYAFRMVEGIVRQQTDAFKTVIGLHSDISRELMAQNQMLHDKVRAQLEATEKAVSEQNAREIARAESEAAIKQREQSWQALLTFAPPILGQKFGVDPSVMVSLMSKGEGNPETEKKLAAILRVLQGLSTEQQAKLAELLTDDQQKALLSVFT